MHDTQYYVFVLHVLFMWTLILYVEIYNILMLRKHIFIALH